jgi:ADP-ribose pyrophosphatase YjhB (NUDIX family)
MLTHRSARLVILDDEDRLLLFRYADEHRPAFWATAGGRVLDGEDFRDAAARELAEETGFDAPVGPFLRERTAVYAVADQEPARRIEHYFLVRCAGGAPDRAGWTAEELRTIRDYRWWPLAELRAADEPVLPEWLPELFAAARSA